MAIAGRGVSRAARIVARPNSKLFLSSISFLSWLKNCPVYIPVGNRRRDGLAASVSTEHIGDRSGDQDQQPDSVFDEQLVDVCWLVPPPQQKYHDEAPVSGNRDHRTTKDTAAIEYHRRI